MQFHDPVEVYFDGAVQVCPARTTVIWEPRVKHYFGHGKRQWDHSWMLCHGRMLARMLKNAGLPLNRPLGADCDALMLKYLCAIYDELSRYSASDLFILEGLFALFIRELSRAERPKEQAPGVPAPLRELLQEIESDLRRPWRLVEMAARVHLSVSHFSATFRRHFAMAPVEYVLRLRMKHAAWLLEDRSLSISEAAYAAGFRDPLYFSKAFKRQFGASPRAFRQNRSSAVAK
jgi:AraC-like DNA-binding protein